MIWVRSFQIWRDFTSIFGNTRISSPARTSALAGPERNRLFLPVASLKLPSRCATTTRARSAFWV